jgi:tRNA(His) 5'-end guanylyltransferase
MIEMESQIKEKIILTSMQKEVLYGALLGDGSLVTHKHATNSYFSYLSKSKQHVEYVMNYFQEYLTNAAIAKGAMFDSRVFTLPKEEVVNCIIWRQNDATRNSIQSVGQANFSQNQLECKNCSDIQDMLMLEKGINWNDFPTHLKRGSCCIKKPFKINEGTDQEAIRNKWVIDTEIPIFTQNKNYVNELVFI